ncbi:MAG: GAF domain-containing protein [Caldilineaceae bacterium]
MAFNWAGFRDPYRPGAGPVVQHWIQPVRRTLLMFRRFWPWGSLVTTSVLLILATLPLQKSLSSFLNALLAAGCYGGAVLIFEWADRHARSPRWQQHLRGVRKVGVLLALTLVHWFLPAASTELWLLYLIPMLTVGVDLEQRWAISLIAATMLLMFGSAWPFTDNVALQTHWSGYLRNGAIRALIGGYAGATSYVLARCLAYQSNTTREMLNRLFDATMTDRWLNTANAVAESISALLSEPNSRVTANVLLYEPARQTMRLMGSSNPEGQKLAQTGFEFAASQGITGWAAQQNQPCFINHTAFDPEHRFLANAAFAGTRSALAVPIRLDNQHSAVLEIESPTPDDVAYEDLQLMNHVAHYLMATHQRSEILGFHQRLAQLGTELANRIIHVEEIGALLEEIGEVGLDLLGADIIRFYYRNPETGQMAQRRTVGHLRRPAAEDSPVNDPQSLVQQLMEAGQLRIFADALHEQGLTRQLAWHRQRHAEPFVIREGILACAAMPLIVGQEKLGLMWVNYRHNQEFLPLLCSSIQLLAPFAALAIKSGVQSVLADRQRRDKLRRDLHDALSARLRNARFAMDRLDGMTPHTGQWKETLLLARLSVSWAMSVVATLQGERATPTLRSVLDDLRTLTDLGGHIYGVPVDLTTSAIPDLPVNPAGGTELLFACEEALQNAFCHAKASRITVHFECQAPAFLQVRIADDGQGFDAQHLTHVGGIKNMRARVEQSLGGKFTLDTQPGQGTRLTYQIPLHEVGTATAVGKAPSQGGVA